MATSSVRIILVEDFEPFRRVLSSILRTNPELQIISEVLDGLEAVRKVEKLQPDLILLDIGLPSLNGIEAARQIRKLSPNSKILFVSQESSADTVREALGTGAAGYVVKTDVVMELLTAVNAVLRGERFVGRRFAASDFFGSSVSRTFELPVNEIVSPLGQRRIEVPRCHDVVFYSDDASLLEGFTQFIGAALKDGNVAIVLATESHRDRLLPRLQAHGLDIGAAIEQERYIALDVEDTLSTFMVNDLPDPAAFMRIASDLILGAIKSAKAQHPRVAACGECAPLLCAQGKVEAAIQLERLWDEIAKTHDVDILCGYPLAICENKQDTTLFQRICAEHSGVSSSGVLSTFRP